MSDEELKPLDSNLSRLLGLEKTSAGAAKEAKARVRNRVEATLFGAGGGGGEGSPSPAAKPGLAALARPLSLLSALVIGAVGGAVVTRSLEHPPAVVYVDRPAPIMVERPETIPPLSPSINVLDLPSASIAAARPPAPSAPPASSASGQLAQERALLDVARTALGRGEGEDTLAALAKHEKRFPNGQLSEEREALAIQALLLLKRYSEADSLGAHFREHYAGSVLLPAVDAALGAQR